MVNNGKTPSLMVKMRPEPTRGRRQWQNPMIPYGQNQARADSRPQAMAKPRPLIWSKSSRSRLQAVGNGKILILLVKSSLGRTRSHGPWQKPLPYGENEARADSRPRPRGISKPRSLWSKSGPGPLEAVGNGKNPSLMVKIGPKPILGCWQWQSPGPYGQNQATANPARPRGMAKTRPL